MNDENRRAGAADLLAALHPSDPLPPFVRASGASYFTADGREFVDLNSGRKTKRSSGRSPMRFIPSPHPKIRAFQPRSSFFLCSMKQQTARSLPSI